MTEDIKAYERFQKAILDGAQEGNDQPETFIPYGRCRRHPQIVISNGQFDVPCNLCEAEQEMGTEIGRPRNY